METIPSIYWMIIVAVIAGFICFVLYQLGMLLKDSRKTLQNVEDITGTVRGTVNEVNDMIIKPIRGIGSGISAISGFMSGLKGETEEDKNGACAWIFLQQSRARPVALGGGGHGGGVKRIGDVSKSVNVGQHAVPSRNQFVRIDSEFGIFIGLGADQAGRVVEDQADVS